ncbi:exonuclease domain-containing protein [Polyangium sp. 6x1]|uniref:exonuclease domain-containing protein n=1 Tax=Polyangium sp. 6x1 TaxID=3042689 RepID=UPI002482F228|nr:exonuclease domain-containing protein [Polyangium sp. 6x1]MDI1446442.1 exonuclease domain-containing protein [Polyangium sp. 6x1]
MDSAERRASFPRGFAVLDVETTGLRWKTDRIVELAVVRTDAEGRVLAELTTLVNPERNPGATHIHGLGAEDLAGAPRFSDVLSELVRFLEGAVLVGHNVKFDLAFLAEELGRLGYAWPDAPRLCTRELAMRVLPGLGEYRLSSCCKALGVDGGNEHRALDDARAAAGVFARLNKTGFWRTSYDTELTVASSVAWPVIEGPSRIVARGEAQASAEPSLLGAMVEGLPEGTSNGSVEGYFSVLDEILEDRRVTEEKADAARKHALGAGLLRGDVTAAHRAYLTGVARAALAGDLGGGLGASDLARVARLLGLPADSAEQALAAAQSGAAAPRPGSTRPLVPGTSICFSGDGEPTKAALEARAVAAGLRVQASVTKKLDVLVIDDPHSMTAKSQKARAYGIRVLTVPVFLTLARTPDKQ